MANHSTSTSSSSSSSFTSFTITQPFLGAPLQFQPALGSKQLEILIDAFVTGSANKQDKLSQVTIDFFNRATVDLLTGALVRRYDVALPYANEQSAYDSQSSGFSPPMFTPSPSSSATFGESFHGSISTPAVRTASRVTKKARKETKKTVEAKIPGFQIMTKDGVDVTSSAGRGIKTKEQREHAHLMRIMKACDACKRKKIRCDPSHRRSHTEMSRTSTKTSASSLSNQSPAVSTPSLSLSRNNTDMAMECTPSYGTNVIDDFVLFPEDTASWNAADMSMPGFDQNYDLGQFNFDINDAGIDMSDLDQSFDFSSFEQLGTQQPSYPQNTTSHYEDVQWNSALASQAEGFARPQHSGSSQEFGNLDSSWFSATTGGLEFNDSTPSGVDSDSSRLNSTPQTPALQDVASANSSSVSFGSMDWSMNDPVSSGDSDGGVSPQSDPQSRRPVASSSGAQPQRRSEAAIQRLLDAVPSYSSESGTWFDSSDQLEGNLNQVPGRRSSDASLGRIELGNSRPNLDKIQRDFNRTSALVTASLEGLKGAPEGYESLSGDLLQLRNVLDNVKSGNLEGIIHGQLLYATRTLGTQLQGLFTHLQNVAPSVDHTLHQKYNRLDPDVKPELISQCSVNTRRLAKAICLTNEKLHGHDPVRIDRLSSIDSCSSTGQLFAGNQHSGMSSVPQDLGLSIATDVTGVLADSGCSSSSITYSTSSARLSCTSTIPIAYSHRGIVPSQDLPVSPLYAGDVAGLAWAHSTPRVNTPTEGSAYPDNTSHETFAPAIEFSPTGLTATAPDIISKVPPHVPISKSMGQEGFRLSSEALSQTTSSSLSVPLLSPAARILRTNSSSRQHASLQQASQQLQNASSGVSTAGQVTTNLPKRKAQLTSTLSAQPSPSLVTSRSAGSSTNSSPYDGEGSAWGAIPQTVREQHLQSSDTTDNVNHTLQTLEGGSSNKRQVSVTAMILCAAIMVVTILQAYSLEFVKAASYLSNGLTMPLFDNLSAVSSVLMFAAIVTSSLGKHLTPQSSTTTPLAMLSSVYSKFSPSFEFSNTRSIFHSSIRRIAKNGHSSSWSRGLTRVSMI